MLTSSAFTILVVDESAAASRFVDLAVGPDGVRVVGAIDAHDALDAIARVRPNVALVAMGMRGPGGQRIAEQLAGLDVPVVLMKGSLGTSPADTGSSLPVISKPLQVRELRDLVDRMSGGAPRISAPAEVGVPLAIQRFAAVEPETVDPVDAWLRDMDFDSRFGVSDSRRRLSIDGESLGSFAQDLTTFRAGPAPAGLQFSRHRSLD